MKTPNRRGPKPGDYTAHKPAVIAALRDGHSMGAIQRERGIPEHVIRAWRDEAGIAPHHPGSGSQK